MFIIDALNSMSPNVCGGMAVALILFVIILVIAQPVDKETIQHINVKGKKK